MTLRHMQIKTMRQQALRLGLVGVLAIAIAMLPASPVWAQSPPPPANVVALSASASVEVVNDWLTLVLSTSRDGADANAVQTQLRLALETALAEARKAAKPGQFEVQTGQFSLFPRYAPPTARNNGSNSAGAIVGWQGQTELILQGRDTLVLTQVAGRITSMTVARVGFSLSREARQKVEAQVTAQAIERFGERAGAVTRAFGMGSYTLREVQVSGDEQLQPVQRPMMRAQAGSMAMAESAVPVEAGNALVTVSVSGTVQLVK